MPEEDDIRRVLSDPQRRGIAKFCVEPHTSTEILERIQRGWIKYSEGDLASDLNSLEKAGAIVYREDKWKTTDFTKKILKKYFGYKE